MAGSAGFTVLAGPQTYKDTLLELCGGSTQGGLRRARRFWRGAPNQQGEVPGVRWRQHTGRASPSSPFYSGPQASKDKFLELGGGSTQGVVLATNLQRQVPRVRWRQHTGAVSATLTVLAGVGVAQCHPSLGFALAAVTLTSPACFCAAWQAVGEGGAPWRAVVQAARIGAWTGKRHASAAYTDIGRSRKRRAATNPGHAFAARRCACHAATSTRSWPIWRSAWRCCSRQKEAISPREACEHHLRCGRSCQRRCWHRCDMLRLAGARGSLAWAVGDCPAAAAVLQLAQPSCVP